MGAVCGKIMLKTEHPVYLNTTNAFRVPGIYFQIACYLPETRYVLKLPRMYAMLPEKSLT